MRYFIIALVLLSGSANAQVQQNATEAAFEEAHRLFNLAVEDEEQISAARAIYSRIIRTSKEGRGRAMVYMGALDLIEAKHTFWPHEKMSLANSGLDKMEKGLKVDPTDIESRFVHGAICHELPFFFGRGDEVEEDFTVISTLLEKPTEPCIDTILKDMQEFPEKEEVLAESQQKRMLRLISQRRNMNGGSGK